MLKCFFAVLKELPVTIEEYVKGKFQKYVYNNGLCILSPAEEFDKIYAKAQSHVHFSYQLSERKLMLLDIQGSSFKLYDPEIATTDLLANDTSLGPNGSQFSLSDFKTFSREWDFEHITSSPYHARSNGKVENAVNMAKRILKKAKLDHKDPYLALVGPK